MVSLVKMLINTRVRQFSSSALFPCSPVKVHKISPPKSKLLLKKSQVLDFYTKMSQIRKLELKLDINYKAGLLRGFLHLYDGQEAVAMGIESALNPTDHIITAYRCHAQQFLRGDNIYSIFTELLGRGKGTNKGKGGSMHLYMPENRFYGGNGIVGAQVPVGAGIALSCKYRKTGEVVVTMFGDGAANQGQVYESANMAALWKLPLIFVIENNRYGMGTSTSRSSFSDQYYTRGDYVPGIRCDGMDITSVKAAMEHAADHCRNGNGPVFVEMDTYRYHGHSMSDPGKTYRAKEEVKQVRKENDAIQNVRKMILDQGWASKEELKEIDKKVTAEVDEAMEKARKDKEADPMERFSDIYYKETPSFIRATDRVKSYR